MYFSYEFHSSNCFIVDLYNLHRFLFLNQSLNQMKYLRGINFGTESKITSFETKEIVAAKKESLL